MDNKGGRDGSVSDYCSIVICRIEHFTGADVHQRDRTAEPERRAGHRQPTCRNRRLIALTNIGHRATARQLRCLEYIIR